MKEQQKDRSAISIYPNPANTELTIQTAYPNQKVEIWSITGIKVLEYWLTTKKETINIAQLPRGLYILKVSDASGNSVSTQKLSVVD